MIVAGARTPIGKFGGAFEDVPAVSLGAHAIRAALDRAAQRPGGWGAASFKAGG
jgi:acetyl-CoA C-acetyltransferase